MKTCSYLHIVKADTSDRQEVFEVYLSDTLTAATEIAIATILLDESLEIRDPIVLSGTFSPFGLEIGSIKYDAYRFGLWLDKFYPLTGRYHSEEFRKQVSEGLMGKGIASMVEYCILSKLIDTYGGDMRYRPIHALPKRKEMLRKQGRRCVEDLGSALTGVESYIHSKDPEAFCRMWSYEMF